MPDPEFLPFHSSEHAFVTGMILTALRRAEVDAVPVTIEGADGQQLYTPEITWTDPIIGCDWVLSVSPVDHA